MEQDLLAYLLDGLDDSEQRQIEGALEESPELRRQLVRLRQLLAPLELLRDEFEPPADLHLRTLRLVAQARVIQPAPIYAPPVRGSERMPPRRWWQRADIAMAACVVFLGGMLTPPLIQNARHQAGIVACADNMRQHYLELRKYQSDHNGLMPVAYPESPLDCAGAALLKMREEGYWRPGMRINCPGRTGEKEVVPPSREEVLKLASTAKDQEWAKNLSGCYATPLPYWNGGPDGGRIAPIREDLGENTPILADRPARLGESPSLHAGNSPNHASLGQNILFQGGHVRFARTRHLPDRPDDTDVYRNEMGQVGPGVHARDSVLVPSEVKVPHSALINP